MEQGTGAGSDREGPEDPNKHSRPGEGKGAFDAGLDSPPSPHNIHAKSGPRSTTFGGSRRTRPRIYNCIFVHALRTPSERLGRTRPGWPHRPDQGAVRKPTEPRSGPNTVTASSPEDKVPAP